ncbi:unknown protein [Seminavis robusta]|uniref:Uncharacterized protein n=1 Tax=Seminavis robusta TaxID=568900 RepID=A0A9N8HC57_9STRA|nr:unknown protein [Seminavis robusta]|eukprot:Sro366_g127630.1 n/a (159) ;mRNA; r:50041-50607
MKISPLFAVLMTSLLATVSGDMLDFDEGSGDPAAGANPFLGLWEGLDTFDGSIIRYSITCDGDTCDVRGSDSYRSDLDPDGDFICEPTGRFLSYGEGTVDGNTLTIPETTFACAESPGVEIYQEGDYLVYDEMNKVATIMTTDTGYRFPVNLHKISCN